MVLMLIDRARSLGMDLWVEGGVLRAKGGRRHQALAKEIAERKEEIIAVLATSPAGGERGVFQALCSGAGTETSPNTANNEVSSPGVPASKDEARFWLGLLRDAGCRIELRDGVPAIDWAAGLATPGRRRDWQANLPVIAAVLRAEAVRC